MSLSTIIDTLLHHFKSVVAKPRGKIFSAYISALSLALVPISCSGEQETKTETGCTANYECKGGRVCQTGICVYQEIKEEPPREEEQIPPSHNNNGGCTKVERLTCLERAVYLVNGCTEPRLYQQCSENEQCIVDRCEESIRGECQNNQREETSCGLNHQGTIEKLCRNQRWVYSECDDPDECVIGQTRTSYSGPPGTLDVGKCKQKEEECAQTNDGARFIKRQEEVIPSEEFCGNDKDEDCDGVRLPCENKILFSLGAIFMINPDGTNKQRIGLHGNHPDWSPNGKKIVFENLVGGGIAIMNTDGTDRTVIYENGGWKPKWSPVGDRILFEDEGTLSTIDTTGRNVRRVAADGAHTASWSPDGRQIVFIRDDEIFLMNANGENNQQVTSSIAGYYEPTWTPDRKIVFNSGTREGEEGELHIMDSEGNHITRLTYTNGTDSSPHVSSDGRNIIFERLRRIYVANIDGGNEVQLLDRAEFQSPRWSPDGRRIAYARIVGNPQGIYVMNADASNQQLLASGGENPDWSPDGRKIVFTRREDRARRIYIINNDGSNQQQLSDNWALIHHDDPRWSHNGDELAFYSLNQGDFDIYLMNPDGSNIRGVFDVANNWICRSPTWSPNDREIACSGSDNKAYIFEPNGNNHRELNNHPDRRSYPVWSSDGKIAFTSRAHLYNMNVDGSDITKLTIEQGEYSSPTWSPDGRKLAFYFSDNLSQGIYTMNVDSNNRILVVDGSAPAWSRR